MRPRLLRILFTGLPLVLVIGCVRVSDRNQANGQTASALNSWGESIIVLHEMGINLEKYHSTDEILSEWKEKVTGLFDTRNPTHPFEHDYWGNPYRWELRRENGEVVIMIGSNGRNGIWENGEGDDLYIEIFIPSNGKPKTHLKVPH